MGERERAERDRHPAHEPADPATDASTSRRASAIAAAGSAAVSKIAGEPDPNEVVANVDLFVTTQSHDRERITFPEIKNFQTGHAFLGVDMLPGKTAPANLGAQSEQALNGADRKTRIGFHPGGDVSLNPLDSYRAGFVEEPELGWDAKGWERYPLTRRQLEAFFGYIEPRRHAPYSVYFFNCTTFATNAIKAAGHTPPPSTGHGFGPVAMPNTLYRAIAEDARKHKGAGTAGTMPLGVVVDPTGTSVPENDTPPGSS